MSEAELRDLISLCNRKERVLQAPHAKARRGWTRLRVRAEAELERRSTAGEPGSRDTESLQEESLRLVVRNSRTVLDPMRSRGAPALATVLVVAGLVGAAASSAEYPGVKPKPLFGTPGAAAYCTVMPSDPEKLLPLLFCWTPNDGWSAAITSIGRRAYTRYYTEPPGIVHDIGVLKGYAPRAPLLKFGQTWRYRCWDPLDLERCGKKKDVIAFTCVSRSTGLTCTNWAKHGFWIGRYRGYRLF